jgi:hypothetical protein
VKDALKVFKATNEAELAKNPYGVPYQLAEYVIGGAATYIFSVLAADELLNG